ncbi:MAG: hypothetical protein KDA21_00725, partial [Phycisphaerales bacterium]|nr:hypothetical protein [Phycisphaerales bacterium]
PLLAAAALLGGCNGASPPRFTVVDARLIEQSDAGYVVHFTIEGENRNPDPLPLHDISYSVVMNGHQVFAAQRFAGRTLPRYGTARIDLPVTFSTLNPDVPAPVGTHEYTLRGQITWKPPAAFAEVLFDQSLHRPDARFNEKGVLEFGG